MYFGLDGSISVCWDESYMYSKCDSKVERDSKVPHPIHHKNYTHTYQIICYLFTKYHCTPLFHWRSLGASHIETHYEDSQSTAALDIGLKTYNIHVARTHWKTCVNCPLKIQQNRTMNKHISRNILYRYLWIMQGIFRFYFLFTMEIFNAFRYKAIPPKDEEKLLVKLF